MKARVVLLAISLGTPLVAGSAQQKRDPMAGMDHMRGMKHDSAAMPIPMPKGMPMIPGLVGLVPSGGAFLPGAAVDPAQLPAAKPSQVVRLRTGDTLDLTAMLVRRTIKGHDFAMYGFNGQVPGPLIRVRQNATIIVRFHNHIDLPSAVHWHGVRLDNRSDGASGVTQEPVAPGGSFVYSVHFPDAGLYWYHPHVREDVEQAMGLFGNMIVDSPIPDYYARVNSEHVMLLDDLLINDDTLVPFGGDGPDFALMGRVGNVLLVNGELGYTLHVKKGEVARFYLTNAASSRTFNLSFAGVPVKVVASDQSRFEHEELVPSVLLAPAERYVVDVRFPRPGRYAIINAVQTINHYKGEFEAEVDTLGLVTVDPAPVKADYQRAFATLRVNSAVGAEIDQYRKYFDKAPD
ncbi:MAG TPA: multicopper oxidase domain-containing protein, partial [Gemmatimonadaceae bacterium]|nr:multicopper oxidase domain-containing protein [Gemmatimonadaceae bacterium]